jgi:hypothetical protein
MIYVSGPGHGGPAVVATPTSKGTYSEIYPNISQDEAGLKKLFKQFSFPGGIPSHVAGDAGLDPRGRRAGLLAQPCLRRRVRQPGSDRRLRVGDGEAETGPLATAGIPTSSSTRSPTARCCRSCTSTATRSPTRPSWPASAARSWSNCCAATAGRPTSSRARPGADARGHGRDARHGVEQIRQIHPGRRARKNGKTRAARRAGR